MSASNNCWDVVVIGTGMGGSAAGAISALHGLKTLVLEKMRYAMSGILPIVFGFSKRPRGHGYTILAVERENPFYDVGTEIRGHEFHYSYVAEWLGEDRNLVCTMKRGTGFIHKKDGVCYKNVLALYTHIHASGLPQWAEAMVGNAKDFRKKMGR